MNVAAPREASERELLHRRSVARLVAVQALYQIEFGGGRPDEVIAEFVDHRFGAEIDGARLGEADADFFRALVRGGAGRQDELDALLKGSLSKAREPSRLDGILRALLRAAAFELLARKDVPARVVIAEYLDVAHAFFTGPEPKLVNGVLDNLARHLRPSEIT
ncbi:MAG: transcription antitermination factor NusB [Alphaproteobacteria bacterium]|nr:transcription antitermination factor NusB [Alphaproteobacteria bacterium]